MYILQRRNQSTRYSFNLEAYSNADVFKTSLFEGKVRVRVKGNNIYLKPDQWYVIIKMENSFGNHPRL